MTSWQASTNSPKAIRRDKIFAQNVGSCRIAIVQCNDRLVDQAVARDPTAADHGANLGFHQPAQAFHTVGFELGAEYEARRGS